MALIKRAASKLGYRLRSSPVAYRKVVEDAAAAAEGNVRRMSWILGCSRQRLYVLLRAHKLWGAVNHARRERAERRIVERRENGAKHG